MKYFVVLAILMNAAPEFKCPIESKAGGKVGVEQWCSMRGYRGSDLRYGKRHGPYRKWHRYKDIIIAEGAYLDGEKHGLWRTWYDNGRLASEGWYRKGKRHGTWREWHQFPKDEKWMPRDDDQLGFQAEYADGEIQGIPKRWNIQGIEVEP